MWHHHCEEQVAWKASLVAWLEFSSRETKNAGIQKKKIGAGIDLKKCPQRGRDFSQSSILRTHTWPCGL